MRKSTSWLLVLGVCAGEVARAADGSWSNAGSGNWSPAANWVGGAVATGTHFTARFTNAVTSTYTVTLDAASSNVTLGNLLFGSPGSSNWNLAAGTINLAVTSGIPTVTVNGGTALVGTRLAGSQGLSKAGTGTLALAAANAWSGGTLIGAGALQVGNYGDTGTLPPGVITNNSSLFFARTNDIVVANNIVGIGQLFINAVGIGALANSSVTLAGTNNFGSAVTVNTGTLVITHSLALGTSNKNINVSNGTAGNPILLLDGSGGDISLPPGITLRLSNARGTVTNVAGNNTIQGPIVVTSGGGPGVVKIAGGSLLITNTVTITDQGRDLVIGGVNTGRITGAILSTTTNTGLTKQDAGLWILTGSNTYPGPTTISGGILQIGDNNAAGSLSTNTISNAGQLVYRRTDIFSAPNSIAGAGSLVQAGGGMLILTANSPLNGPTFVSNGTLVVNGILTNSRVTVVAGGRLSGNNRVGGASVSGTLAPGVGVGQLLGGADLVFESGGRFEVELNNATGTAGSGWDLVSFAGLTNNATTNSPLVFDLRSQSGTNAGQAANFNGFQGYTVKVANVSAGQPAGFDDPARYVIGTTNFLNVTAGAWSLLTNATDVSLVYTPAVVLDPASYIWDASNDVAGAQDGSGTWTQSGTNWWDGTQSVAWSNGTAVFGAGGGDLYAVQVAAGGVLAGGLSFNAGSRYAIAGPGGIGLAPTATLAADAEATIATTLSGIQLVKAGTGTVTVAGDATAFSSVSINAGRLAIGNGGTAGALAGIITNNGRLSFNRSDLSYFLGTITGTGAVELNGGGPIAFTAASSIGGEVSGTGTLWKQSTALLTFTGTAANTASGELVVQNGTVVLVKPSGVTAWAGPIHVTNDPTSSAFLQLAASEQIADSSVIRFSRQGTQWPYLKLMGNTETIAGVSCLTGNGVIENTESESAVLPLGHLIVSNQTGQTFEGYMRNRAGGNAVNYLLFTKWGTATQTLIGPLINYTGRTYVAQGALELSNTTAFASDITNDALVIIRLTNTWNYGFRQLSGTGAFVKEGPGSFRLDGTNRYTGPLTISNGYVDCYGDGSMASNAPLFVEGSQGLVLYQGSTQWVASLVGTATTANVLGNTAGRTGVVVSLASGTAVYNGRIYQGSGPVRLVMAGSGEQVLAGTVDNSSANVEVQSGTLTLAKTSTPVIHAAAGSAAVLGGTLKLAGTGADQIFSNTPVTVQGGVFDLNGRNEGIFSLLGTGGTIRNDAAGTTAELKIGEGNGSGTNASAIADGVGTARLVKVGAGVQVLHGNNTFSGGAFISNGTLRANNSVGVVLGCGPAEVSTAGTLDGTGSVGRVVAREGGTISGGENGVGQLTFTNLTLHGGSVLRVDVMDFAGAPGATNGIDLLNVTGPLTVGGSAAQRINLQLRTVNAANVPGTAANFNPSAGYTVTVASASSIASCPPDSFALDLSGFLNAFVGAWTVVQSGNDLRVVYTPGIVDTDPVEAWTNVLAVTFCGYNRAETLTNFPALIVLSRVDARGLNMYDMLADPVNGHDLRFTVSGATTNFLNYEVEKWDTNGNSYVWVQVPQLSAGTQIELRGGNPNAVSGRPIYAVNGATWSNGYLSVWHFAGGSAQDALRNYNGTRFGTPVYSLGGLAGDGLSFNGADQFVQLPAGMDNFTNGLTIEAWWKPAVAANWSRIIDFGCGPAFTNIVLARNATSQNVRFEHYGSIAGTETFDIGGNPIPGLGIWAHWCLTHTAGSSNNATANFFMDGTVRGTKTDSSVPPLASRTTNLIGKSNWASDSLANGTMDELRISTVARSSNWVYATWLNMLAPNAFYCLAGEDRTMYRDEDETTPGRQDGAGTWNFANSRWMNQYGANLTWLQGATAIFGSGTNSAVTNVLNVAETIQLAGLTFTNGSSYTITGNTGRLLFPAFATNFAARDAELQARISGSGFVKTGPARLTLNPVTGANDYTGAMVVAEGTLALGGTTADGNIRGDLSVSPGATVVMVAANPFINTARVTVDGTMDMAGFTDYIASLAGGGLVTNNNNQLALDLGSTNVFAGNLQLGTGTLDIRANNGAGVQTLGGTNRYGNLILERAGANLVLDGGTNFASGTVFLGTQADGGTLSLDGGAVLTVAGNVHVGEQSGRHGDIFQTNGNVSVAGQVRVGHYPSETSTWVMSAGSLTMTNEPTVNPFGGAEANGGFYLGIDGVGRFTMAGGTLKSFDIVLDNRGDTAGTDMLTVEGGTVNLGRWGIQGNASTLIQAGGGEFAAFQSWTSTLPFVLTGTNGGTVFNPTTNSIVLNAGASGTGGLTVAANGSGSVWLRGTASYTGPTAVSNGTLYLNSQATATVIEVASGGTLAGTGTAGTVTVAGTLAPGENAGTLNAGQLTLAAGSRLTLQISNFAGTAGTAWDLLNVAGALTANAGPIVFDVRSLSGTTPGGAANFDAFNSYTLRVVNVTGSFGFDVTNVTLVVSNFLNTYIGSWSVKTNGTAIDLVYATTATSNPSALALWDATNDVTDAQDGAGTWDATSTNWWDLATSQNIAWNNGMAIFSFYSVATDAYTVSVSAPGVLAESLLFAAGGRYTLSGPGGIGLQGIQEVTVSSPAEIAASLSGSILTKKGAEKLTLSGDASAFSAYQVEAGTLSFGSGGLTGSFNAAAPVISQGTVAFDFSAPRSHQGPISGAGELHKRGSGRLTLGGTNTFDGLARISAGTLALNSARALGGTAQGTFVSDGATLDLFSQVAGTNGAAEVISIAGYGADGNGALVSSGSASPGQMVRYLVITGAASIGGSGPGWIAIDGTGPANTGYIDGGTNALDKVGSNIVMIRSGIAVTVGTINVRSGNLSIETSATMNNDHPLNIYTGGLFYSYSWTQTLGRTVNFHGGTLQDSFGVLNVTGTFNLVSGGSLYAAGTINHTGTISGASGLLINANATTSIIHLAGSSANTAAGELTLFNGTTRFDKPAGVSAWAGSSIILSNNATASCILELLASEQIADATVIRFLRQGTAFPYFKLLGRTETVAGLDSPSLGVLENTEADASTGTDGTLVVSNSADFVFAGYLRDKSSGTSTNRINLRKQGLGRQTLTGNSIGDTGWTGWLQVDQGTVVLSNTFSTGFRASVTNSAAVELVSSQLASGSSQMGNVGARAPLLTGGGVYTADGLIHLQGEFAGSGTLDIRSGRLANDARGGIWTGCTAAVTVHNSAIWDMRATMLQCSSLRGSGTVINSYYANPGGATNVLTVGVANGSGVFAGSILGTVAVDASSNGLIHLVKLGTGTQILSGVNNYAGTTAISNGTLIVDGRLGTGNVLVSSGGTLGGAGVISGSVTSAGTVAPGSGTGAGRLTLGGFVAGGTLEIELGGVIPGASHDQLVITAPATLGGNLSASLINAHLPAAGSTYTVLTATALSGSFANVTNGGTVTSGGTTWKVHYGAGSAFAANEVVLENVTASPDSDGDGLPDAWELVNFGGLTNANATSQSDADGVSDFAEFIAGTDPNSAASFLRFTNEIRLGEGQVLFWPSTTSRLYDLEWNTNLGSGLWTPLATGLLSTPPANSYTNGPGPSWQHYRLKVRIAP